MWEADDEMKIEPEQVVQMGVYFGIKREDVIVDSYLFGIAMCALYAPLPPFWHIVGFSEELNKIREERHNDMLKKRTTIDFAMSHNGEGDVFHFKKENYGTEMLKFARDKVGGENHLQSSHPSDSYWREVFDSTRSQAEDQDNLFFTDEFRERCSILPFLSEMKDYEGLWWYDFLNCVPIMTNDPDKKQLKFPKLGRREDIRLQRGSGRSKKGRDSIFKFNVPKDLKRKSSVVDKTRFDSPNENDRRSEFNNPSLNTLNLVLEEDDEKMEERDKKEDNEKDAKEDDFYSRDR